MNGERSFLPAQRKEAQLRHIYVVYVQLYFNRARIRPDYANYIFAKHKTGSVISYSHYTRFYALIRRVCTLTKTWGLSFSIRNKDGLQKGNQPQSTGIEGNNSQNLHPSPKWREVSRQSRETARGDKRPPQPRPSSAHTIRGRSRSRI